MDEKTINDLCDNTIDSLPNLLDKVNNILQFNFTGTNSKDVVDLELLKEMKEYTNSDVRLYFGNTLRDIKCVIEDENCREHEIFIQCKGPKKLHITCAKMPCSHLIQSHYTCLSDIIKAFTKHVSELSCYFSELEQIDKLSAVMEPKKPTFAEDFRRIYLDDRTWLHVEVTSSGLAENIHIIGCIEEWHNKLQTGLIQWDHDKSIVENILTVFELPCFPFPTNKSHRVGDEVSGLTCSICLCVELPGGSGLPQPLCKNYACGVYYHRSCIYQWLTSRPGMHQPAFGVVVGTCPCCFQPIEICKND